MIRYRARILAFWEGTGTDTDPYRPSVPYSVESVTDVTGQPSENLTPSPNSLTVEIVCSAEVLGGILAGKILWTEAIEEVVPLG